VSPTGPNRDTGAGQGDAVVKLRDTISLSGYSHMIAEMGDPTHAPMGIKIKTHDSSENLGSAKRTHAMAILFFLVVSTLECQGPPPPTTQ
jgi:hypothetical protein